MLVYQHSDILSNYHITERKNAVKYIFLHILKRKFRRVKHTFWVRFGRIFNVFLWNLERMLPNNQAKKLCRGIFIFASLKSYDDFSEENACFFNSQSLTAFQKQTRQVIKISRHRFFRERCQEDIAILIAFSCSNLSGNEHD